MNNKINNPDDAQEIAKSLRLAIAQINMSMRESDESVQQLIASMTAVNDCLNQTGKIINKPDDQTAAASLDDIQKYNRIARQHMQDAVIAFQFYDRMSQRFAHVEENLQAIAELIIKPGQQHPELWSLLQKKLRSVYSTEQEQTMYQALLHGISEAEVSRSPILSNSGQTAGEIELF